MPSVKNPNFTSKNRVAVRAAKLKAQRRKQSDAGRAAAVLGAAALAKTDLRRGARPGLLPTSGPNRALSRKKARKLEKQMAHALKRKMAAEGEVDMKGSEALWLAARLGRG